MIYLDNAATSFPKPPQVVEAVRRCMAEYCGNPGRGSHPLGLAAAEQVYACREAVSALLGVGAPERVSFTLNATHALNVAIQGALFAGGHALISELEHNAVRRPLCALAKAGRVRFDAFPVVGLTPAALLSELESRLRPDTRAVICTHASNVCSVSLPVAEIGALCRRRGLLFVLDAAQSAGLLPIDMQKMKIDMLAAPAHKSLYGIQGCGVLALGEGVLPPPLMTGGSGVDSLADEMPADPPERYEAGTLPTPAVVGLLEGIGSLRQGDPQEALRRECALFRAAAQRLQALGLRVYLPEHEGAVLLFDHPRVPANAIGNLLARQGICVRTGLHCAPMAHRALGTRPEGAVRVSFGRFNTPADVDALWLALKELPRG
jgi:cysteine desulfurase family protein